MAFLAFIFSALFSSLYLSFGMMNCIGRLADFERAAVAAQTMMSSSGQARSVFFFLTLLLWLLLLVLLLFVRF